MRFRSHIKLVIPALAATLSSMIAYGNPPVAKPDSLTTFEGMAGFEAFSKAIKKSKNADRRIGAVHFKPIDHDKFIQQLKEKYPPKPVGTYIQIHKVEWAPPTAPVTEQTLGDLTSTLKKSPPTDLADHRKLVDEISDFVRQDNAKWLKEMDARVNALRSHGDKAGTISRDAFVKELEHLNSKALPEAISDKPLFDETKRLALLEGMDPESKVREYLEQGPITIRRLDNALSRAKSDAEEREILDSVSRSLGE